MIRLLLFWAWSLAICYAGAGCNTVERQRSERQRLVELREVSRGIANQCDASGREADRRYAEQIDRELERIDRRIDQIDHELEEHQESREPPILNRLFESLHHAL